MFSQTAAFSPKGGGEGALELWQQPAQVAGSHVTLVKQFFESTSDSAGFLPLREKAEQRAEVSS